MLNLGLDGLLDGRPCVAPGIAATQAAAMLVGWTSILALLAAEEAGAEDAADLGFVPVLSLGLAWTTAWWGLRATQVEGCGAIVAAFAAPVGARMLAGLILADRAHARAAADRRKVAALRGRRLEGGVEAEAPPGA